jgi:hypothetical protein
MQHPANNEGPVDNQPTLCQEMPTHKILLIHMYAHDTGQIDLFTTFPVCTLLHPYKGVVCLTIRNSSNLLGALTLIQKWDLKFQGILHILSSKGCQQTCESDDLVTTTNQGHWTMENNDSILITLVASRPTVEKADACLPLCNPSLEFVHHKQYQLDLCRCLVERCFSTFLGSVCMLYTTQGIATETQRRRLEHTFRSMRSGCISLNWTTECARTWGCKVCDNTQQGDWPSGDAPLFSSVIDTVNRTVAHGNGAWMIRKSGTNATSTTGAAIATTTRAPRCGKCLHCLKKHWRKSCLMTRRVPHLGTLVPFSQDCRGQPSNGGFVQVLTQPPFTTQNFQPPTDEFGRVVNNGQAC